MATIIIKDGRQQAKQFVAHTRACCQNRFDANNIFHDLEVAPDTNQGY